MLNHSEWNESGANFRSTQSMISLYILQFQLDAPLHYPSCNPYD